MDKRILRNLTAAVRNGHLEKVRTIVHKCGFSDSCPWSEGYDLLCTSIGNQHTEIAKLLLSSGSKVNDECEKPSNTPLHLAVMNDDIEMVELLLDRGANIHAKNEYDSNVLHDAIKRGKMKIAELLLHHGANVSTANQKGFTPLHYAVRWCHEDIVKLLLKNNACVNTKTTCEIAPLHIAAWKGYVQIAKDLLNHGADTESKCTSTQSLNLDIPYTTLNRRRAKSINLAHYFTPLHIAIKGRHETVVKLLLEHGAKVDANYDNGKTMVHLAALGGYSEIVEILLQHDANINGSDEDGRTALHCTVDAPPQELNSENHNIHIRGKMTDLLLSKGANVNAKTKNGETPLHVAAKNDCSEIIESLLQHDADINPFSAMNPYMGSHTTIRFWL